MRFRYLNQLWIRRCEIIWDLLKSGRFKTLFLKSLDFLHRLVKPAVEINYKDWRERWVELPAKKRAAIVSSIPEMPIKPVFTLLLNAENIEMPILESTIFSTTRQLYPYWNLELFGNVSDLEISDLLTKKINDDRIRFSSSTQNFEDQWIIQLTPGELLHEAALFSLAECISTHKKVKIIYTDNDHINPQGNYVDPHMKPDWNSELLKGMNYFTSITTFHSSLWRGYLSTVNNEHRKIIQITNDLDTDEILHVPKVLSTLPTLEDDSHLFPSYVEKTLTLESPLPRVSILIPTKNQGKMLEKCIASLESKTDYPYFEVVIIDHESKERKAKKVINHLRRKQNFKFGTYSGDFNFSAMMNEAAKIATGDIFVLLNNDTEIVEPKWLEEMVSEVSRRDVGIVGALLLFSDRTIQHAGIHPGIAGLMGHGHKHLPESSPGYFNRLKVSHEVAAVTGACLAIQKTTWNELGGLDEEYLSIAYNDVDLCLKARSVGLKVLLNPKAKLIHHESKSRGFDNTRKKIKRLEKEILVMKERWGDFLLLDPAYSPNLSLKNDSFTLSEKPRP